MLLFAKLLPFLDEFGIYGSSFEGYYDPVWLRCQDAVLVALRDMADAGRLPGMSTASIIAVEQPLVSRFFGTGAQNVETPLEYPGAMVWPFQQEATDIAAGSNLLDEITYPVAISLVDKGSSATGTSSMVGSKASRRRHMTWRENISKRFRHFECPGITEIRDVYIRPQLYAIPSVYQNDDLYHGAIVVDFISRESRDDGEY